METAMNPGPGLCCKPGGQLDRSHGFGLVHCTQWNQLIQDDYDKKAKQATEEKRLHTPMPTRPRKLTCKCTCHDTELALPTQATQTEESSESSSGGSEPEPSGHQLFCLDYEAERGEVTSVIVYQDSDPGRVSEEVLAHTPLDPPIREAIKLRVKEIAKRQG